MYIQEEVKHFFNALSLVRTWQENLMVSVWGPNSGKGSVERSEGQRREGGGQGTGWNCRCACRKPAKAASKCARWATEVDERKQHVALFTYRLCLKHCTALPTAAAMFREKERVCGDFGGDGLWAYTPRFHFRIWGICWLTIPGWVNACVIFPTFFFCPNKFFFFFRTNFFF